MAPGEEMPVLRATGVVKRYGGHTALHGVDLAVGAGELVGLLGPNGAGKSTLVKIAVGLVRPTQGEVLVGGAPPSSARARRAVGYLAELFRFPGWATADEVLTLHGRLAGAPDDPAGRTELLGLVGLAAEADRRVEAMSKGMQQRLGIAQALVGRPELLLLDEPTSALDPAGRRTVRDALEELRRRGVAVLLNTHLLSEVERTCDRVAIIDAGRVVAAGSPAELEGAGAVELETELGVEVVTGAGREDVPRLVAERVAAGRAIYGARVTRSSLEEVYLRVVGDREGVRSGRDADGGSAP